MKTFSVKGGNWDTLIDIDETVYEKYGDMAMEAMSQAFDLFVKGELQINNLEQDLSIGFIMTCCESGFKDDPDKEVICLSHFVAENAGYHQIANDMRGAVADEVEDQEWLNGSEEHR